MSTRHIHITTWVDDLAPKAEQWRACMGEYDLDKHVSSGPTEADAVEHLIDFHAQPDGSIQ